MSRFLYTHHNFNNGELNPRLLGQTNVKEYFNSGKTVKNFVISPNGGLDEVIGTTFLNTYSSIGEDAKFTYGGKFVFFSPFDIYRIVDSTSSGGESQILSPISITTASPLSNIDDLVYGTHVYINKTLFVTDKNGAVEPIVYYYEGDLLTVSSFTVWAGKANNQAFNTENAMLRSGIYSPLNGYEARRITYASGTVTTAFSAFTSGMVGKYIIVRTGSSTDVVLKITAFTNSSTVSTTAIVGSLSNTTYTAYKLPLMYQGNTPKGVSFYQNRLIFFNTPNSPDIIFNSVTNNLAQFEELAQDTSAGAAAPFQIQPASTDSSSIAWVIPDRTLSFGSEAQEYIVSNADGVYSNSTTSVSPISKYGSAGVGLAVKAQSSTYFIERDGATLREMFYSEENGGYSTRNLSKLGTYTGSISKMIYDYASRRLYLTTDIGLVCVSIDQTLNTVGFSRVDHLLSVCGQLNTQFGTMVTDGRSLLRIKSESDHSSLFCKDLYLSADPYIVSASEYHHIVPDNYFVTFVGASVYYWNGTSWVSTPVITASGHPLYSDGIRYISVPTAYLQMARSVTRYESIVETTPIQAGAQLGDSQGALKRVDRVFVRVLETSQGFKVGTTDTSMETAEITGEYTGIVVVNPEGTPEYDHIIRITNTSNNPVTILSISARGLTEEE